MDPRDRLILALDLPGVPEAEAMVARLGEAGTFYKIGLELAYAGGLAFAAALARKGKRIFLDLKLYDIPNTVARAVPRVADLGATYLTVHAYPQTMEAAVRAARGTGLKLLAVTVMTSYDDADLAEAGYAEGVAATVARRAAQARDAGIDGLILSPAELPAVRAITGDALELITPGVRPAGAALADQKRVATPGQAIRAGADRIVVGRPVLEAADPRVAAGVIAREIEEA